MPPIAAGSLIAIYAKPGQPRLPELVQELEQWLRARGYRALRDAPASPPPALAIALGGDGTILHVAQRLAAAATPVLAVHLGSFGFLNETELEDLYSSLERVLAGGGRMQRRARLHVRLERADATVAEFEPLNEAVVGKSGLARLLTIDLAIDGQPVGISRADGLIVATPTGSTGYNLSAGGPVVHPGVEALLLTPICPNALRERPWILPAQATIALTLRAGEPAHLTLDGQQGLPLAVGDRVVCTQSEHPLQVVSAAPVNAYERLRRKLGWGA